MRQVVIENPVINSPFEEPHRHFRFDDEQIWRDGGYTHEVTRPTARLLEYWQHPDRARRLFFCQIEALENADLHRRGRQETRPGLDRELLARVQRGREPGVAPDRL
jgi:hypothetical protein